MDVDGVGVGDASNNNLSETTTNPDKANKKTVSFAPDVKASSSASVPGSGTGVGIGTITPAEEGTKEGEAEAPLDGVIGQLEIHRSGAVRMRLENGILLDVSLLVHLLIYSITYTLTKHQQLYHQITPNTKTTSPKNKILILIKTTGNSSNPTLIPPTRDIHQQRRREQREQQETDVRARGGEQAV